MRVSPKVFRLPIDNAKGGEDWVKVPGYPIPPVIMFKIKGVELPIEIDHEHKLTVGDVKKALAEHEGVPVKSAGELKIKLGDKILDDDDLTLSELDIEPNMEFELICEPKPEEKKPEEKASGGKGAAGGKGGDAGGKGGGKDGGKGGGKGGKGKGKKGPGGAGGAADPNAVSISDSPIWKRYEGHCLSVVLPLLHSLHDSALPCSAPQVHTVPQDAELPVH